MSDRERAHALVDKYSRECASGTRTLVELVEEFAAEVRAETWLAAAAACREKQNGYGRTPLIRLFEARAKETTR